MRAKQSETLGAPRRQLRENGIAILTYARSAADS